MFFFKKSQYTDNQKKIKRHLLFSFKPLYNTKKFFKYHATFFFNIIFLKICTPIRGLALFKNRALLSTSKTFFHKKRTTQLFIFVS